VQGGGVTGPGDYIGQGPGERLDWPALWAAADPARYAAQPVRRLTLAQRYRAALEAEKQARGLADEGGDFWRRMRQLRAEAPQQLHAVGDMAARAMATGRMPDSELRALAERRAQLLGGLIDGLHLASTPEALLAWLNGHVQGLQGRAFAFEGERPEGEQLRGFLARARCSMWWRRQLRRAAVRAREDEARAAGEVCATRRQPYVSNDTAHRHQQRAAANAAMMAATQLENDDGQAMSLADLAAASVSNKAIRRGELMTRITGCERLAEHLGMRGVFLTLTAPSRFHRVLRTGASNPRADGSIGPMQPSGPRDAQAWLCAAWAKARAKLQRLGVLPFGFRVAEPHHDGCPHWHGLLWVKPGRLWSLVRVVKRAWLKDHGDEPGAREHRVKAVLMRPGGASGYIAKYIAKNIDDAGAVGAEGHTDDGGGQGGGNESLPVGDSGSERAAAAQGDLFGGTAKRVEAWASAHGIRQFQAIGQPPVTVWRELRRIPAQAQGGATPRLAVAFEAVNRDGARRADWAAYVVAQGGLWRGREYLLRMATVAEVKAGRYESVERPAPKGVFDSTGPGDWHRSARREWRPRGEWPKAPTFAPKTNPNALYALTPAGYAPNPKHAAWEVGQLAEAARLQEAHAYALQEAREFAAQRAAPWTRVNNCTRRGAADLMQTGIVGAVRAPPADLFDSGESSHHERPPDEPDPRLQRLRRFIHQRRSAGHA
jgi:Bacteriophage replication gene A protein (GPA)